MEFSPFKAKSKTEEELAIQTKEASTELGAEIVPQFHEKIESFRLKQLKDQYPARYDIYLKLLRANKSKDTSSLNEEEKMSYKIWMTAMNNLGEYLSQKDAESEAQLRPHQEQMLHVLHDFFEKGGREGYIVLPTQVGKTAIAAKLTAILKLKTLSTTERRFDVEQMKKEYEKFGVTDTVGIVGGSKKELDTDTTITTYTSLRNTIKNGELDPKKYELLLLNEAHHALGDKTMESIDNFEHALTIGLTATPDFSEEKGLWWILKNKIYEMETDEAIQEGLLANVRVFTAEVDIDLSNVKVKQQGDFDTKELEKIVNVDGVNKGAVEIYKKMFEGKLAMANCTGIEHAKSVANEFNKSGIPAVALSGTTPQNIYEKAVQDFHEGNIKVICSADLLIESFSEPRASVVLNLRPTLSMRLAQQRGGRVLALDEENPGKESIIVDFVYKGKQQLVTYYDVLGDAQVSHSTNKQGQKKEGIDYEKIQRGLLIEGIKVHTDPKEVVRFIKGQESLPKKERKVDEKKWETMLQQTGRSVSEMAWRGSITDLTAPEMVVNDDNKDFAYKFSTMKQVSYKNVEIDTGKILNNPEWFVNEFLGREKYAGKTKEYKGELGFKIGKVSFIKDKPYVNGEAIRDLVESKHATPVPIEKADAILSWLMSSKKAKFFRNDFNALLLPVKNKDGTLGVWDLYSMPYREKDFSGFNNDVILSSHYSFEEEMEGPDNGGGDFLFVSNE